MNLRGGRMNRFALGALALLVLVAMVSLVMIRDARTQIQDKEERARMCFQNAEDLNAKLHVSLGKVKQLEESLKEEMDSRKNEGNKYRRQVEDLKALRAQDKIDKENTVKRLEETAQSLKKQVKDLEKEFSRQMETNHNLLKEKNEYATRMDEAVQELEKYKVQAAELNAQMKQQISELKVELKNGGDCKVNALKMREELNEAERKLKECLGKNPNGSFSAALSGKKVSLSADTAVTSAGKTEDKAALKDGVSGRFYPLIDVRGMRRHREGVLRPPPDGKNSERRKSLEGGENNQNKGDKLSSPRTKTMEGVGQKPPSEDEVGPKANEDDVIQRPSMDNAEEQEDDQGPAPVLRLQNLGDSGKDAQVALQHHRAGVPIPPAYAVVNRPNRQTVGQKLPPLWHGGRGNSKIAAALRDNQVNLPLAAPNAVPRRGDQHANNQLNHNYADFDDGDANRHNFDQIGDGEVPPDRLKQRYDYLGENNQEEGDDAVDGQIPAAGEDEGKDDNILPAPPLEQNGEPRGRNAALQQHHARRRFGRPGRSGRRGHEPGEVFVVSGNDGEEGVMVNPH